MSELTLRTMSRAEVHDLLHWAAREGWNPGLHDADAFWATDPEGFIAATMDGKPIGGGSIVSYDGQFGFMGLFIVAPEHRRQGIGSRLWEARKNMLLGRLRPGAAIGMDGVFAMQSYYARGGFQFSHRNVRFEAVGQRGRAHPNVVPLTEVPFERVVELDAACFVAPRRHFLEAWLTLPQHWALGYVANGVLCGFGVLRRCHKGFKIGPLFANDGDIAEALYGALADGAEGEPVFLDVPEINAHALRLVAAHGMKEVFGCARMYLGPAPAIAYDRIFGVTTFELG